MTLQDWDPLDPLQTIKEILHKPLPNVTAQPPATLSTFLPTNVSQSQGQDYEAFVEQAGNQANFPSATSGPFALGGVVSRYVAIGGADAAAAAAPKAARLNCEAAGTLCLRALYGVNWQSANHRVCMPHERFLKWGAASMLSTLLLPYRGPESVLADLLHRKGFH